MAQLLVARLLLGITMIAAVLFLMPGDHPKSTWLVIACGLSAGGPFFAMGLSGYLGWLARRPKLYMLFPAASIGGQTMFLLFSAQTIAAEHFSARRVAFNVNWPVLVGATVGAYLLLRFLTARLERRWEPFPEMVCPLVAFWMGINLLALELVSAFTKQDGFSPIGWLPNALPHLIMGSIGFWIFVRLSLAPSSRSPSDSRS